MKKQRDYLGVFETITAMGGRYDEDYVRAVVDSIAMQNPRLDAKNKLYKLLSNVFASMPELNNFYRITAEFLPQTKKINIKIALFPMQKRNKMKDISQGNDEQEEDNIDLY
jgi:hypothetical protein